MSSFYRHTPTMALRHTHVRPRGLGSTLLLRAHVRRAALRLQAPCVGRVPRVLLHEGIGVIRLHRREGVVHIPVVCLVGEHALQGVHPHRLRRQLPICDREIRRRQRRPRLVQGRARRLDLVDDVGVRRASRLLQVPHEAVDGLGVHNVERCEEWRHQALGSEHQGAGHEIGLEHAHANQQVHPLVLRLLQQRVDPAEVTAQAPQGAQVPDQRRHEARHACDALEHDEPPLHRLHRRVLRLEAREQIEASIQRIHQPVHAPVAECLRLVLVQVREALVDFLLAPNVVLHQVDDRSVPGLVAALVRLHA
mmetsp:Transcript_114110/g.329608  ORF Transcript_114110/g.329608 Transcript_114110/m.329608 type:complete len:308 (-) Transcript_114110:281-1204(-)